MTDYTKQAKRIYKQVLARHPKGAVSIITPYKLKPSADSSAELRDLKDALRKLNKRLNWGWNTPGLGVMRIRVAQKRIPRKS